MDEKAIKERFKKARDIEKEQLQEKRESIEEKQKKRTQLEEDIKRILANWEEEFPKSQEIIDQTPFVESSGISCYLFKKKGDNKTYVLIIDRGAVKEVQSVAYFMETFIASDAVLNSMKDRIPQFVEYLSTQVKT